MTYKIRAAAIAAIGLSGGMLLAAGCDDDPAPAQPVEAGTDAPSNPDTSMPDAGGSDTSTDTSQPPPPFAGNLGFFNARSQATDSGIPELLIPSSLVTTYPTTTGRQYDFFVAGGFAPLGCGIYKFTSTNPNDPKGPSFSTGDFGDISMSGHTGGTGPAGPIPKPVVCKRVEYVPGKFAYNCNLPAAPVDGFLKPTDNLTFTVAGGADSQGELKINSSVSPINNLVVTNNLWGLPSTALDGTEDLQLNYNCGGAACGQATLVAVLIDTTDSPPSPDGGAQNPFDFPNPTTEFGSLLCIDLFPKNPTGFKVPKEALAYFPKSWKAARVTVATVAAGQGLSKNGIPSSVFAGDGVFGITHKP